MSKQIKKNEIAEKGVLDNLLTPLKELLKVTDRVDAKLKDTAKTINESFNFKESSKGLRELEVNLKKTNKLAEQKKKVQQDQTKIEKQLADAKGRLNKLSVQEERLLKARLQTDQQSIKVQDQKTKQLITEERLKQSQLRTDKQIQAEKEKEARQNAKLAKQKADENNAYKQLSKASRDYKNESKRLGAELLKLEQAGDKNTKEFKDLSNQYKTVTASARTTDGQLKKLDQTVGDNFRNVGNYRDATSKLTGALGKLGLAFGIGAVVRNVTGIMTSFNQAQQDLLAISGKSAEQLTGLTQQAKELGATTAFSATQITELQIELAKLGFTTNEITQSTGGISAFASATGVELPQAAKLAGSALRAFNLDASEMDRVTSVLGVATTKTALDVSALETGLSSVAPVAASFGFSIEDTTALLGQLSNAGFDASSAATSTRNILLNLADANGSLAQELGRPITSADDLAGALQELQAKGIDLGEALELTDKRSVAAFQTFMQGSDSLVGLRDSITDVNDELKEMEEKRLDSVNGQLQLLSSAWEGVILGTDEATGATTAMKNVLGFLAENLATILKVVALVGAAFLSYKATIIATKVATTAYQVATKGAAIVQALFTGNLKKATAGMRVFNKVTKANILGAIVTTIMAAIAAYNLFTSATDEQTEAEKRREKNLKEQKELQEDFNNQLSQATSGFVSLIEQLKITNKNSKERADLIEKINSEYGTTLKNIKDETKFMDQLTVAVDAYIAAQKRKILTQQNETKIGELLKEQVELEERLKELRLTERFDPDNVTAASDRIERDEKRLNQIKELIRSLAGDNLELSSAESNANKQSIKSGSEKVKGLKDQNEELQKQVLTIEEIQKLLDSGETLEDIEDSEIGQLTDAIDKDLTERLTKINDFERDRTLTEKEASDQRLIAEIDALNEKRRIYELYDRDVIDIDKELSEKRLALSNKFLQKDKDIQEDLAENVRQTVEQVGNAIADTYSNIFQRQIDELKKQEDTAKQVYGTLEKLASEGNIAAQQSLAEQIQAQQDAQREQIKLQQKQANIEKARQVYAIIQSQLDEGKSPSEAIASTGGFMTAIQGLIQSLPSFYEGTEDTGKAGKALDNKGGRLAVLHNNERVLTADQNKHLQGIPNPMIPVLVNKALDSAGNSYDLLAIDELRRTRQAIEKLPQSTYQLESAMGQIVKMVATHKTGNTTTKNTYK